MTTHDKKATSNTTYRTVGWTVKRYDMPIDAPGQQSIVVVLHNYDDIQFRDDPLNSAYVYCYSYGDGEAIFNSIGGISKEWQHQLYAYGDMVYIDMILTVCEGDNILGGLDAYGNAWGEVYYTYEGISQARDWASKDSLRTHFNKSVFYPARLKEKEFNYVKKATYTTNRLSEPKGNILIGSNELDKEKFNVEEGIPTGESLYVCGKVSKYWYNIQLNKITVTMNIPIKVITNYIIKWKGYDGSFKSENRNIIRWYYVKRSISYWEVEDYDIRYLEKVILDNYAFNNNKITIPYKDTTVGISVKILGDYYNHVIFNDYNEVVNIDGGEVINYDNNGIKPNIPEDNQQIIANQQVGNIYSRNDYLKIGNTVIMDNNYIENSTDVPKQIPEEYYEIYEKNFLISNTKKNSNNNLSSGNGAYRKYNGSTLHLKEVTGINGISIHTPVVCKLKVEDDKRFNQLVNILPEYKTAIIGRDLKLSVSNYGQHREILGYGTKDYSKYVKDIQVKIPFEVFIDSRRIEQNTWFSISDDVTFQIPIGVKEGKYEIKSRVFANNSDTIDNPDNHIEKNANLQLYNYIATDTVAINLIGRIYELEVGENKYKVGVNDENGIGQEVKYTLPFVNKQLEGSTTMFSLYTVGNMNQDTDYIKVELKFLAVNESGKREYVDLYYPTSKNEIDDTTYVRLKKVDSTINIKSNAREYVGHTEKNKVANLYMASQGKQKWTSNLTFPDNVYIIPKSMEINEKNEINEKEVIINSIKKGYLLVNMEIWSVNNYVRRLSYINKENYQNGYCNMWKTEGYNKEFVFENQNIINLALGDTIIFEIKKDYSKYYKIVGTH